MTESDKIRIGFFTIDRNIYKYVLSAGFATCIAEVATLPICTIKTNYQNNNRISIPNTIHNIWNHHGLRGFYNASGWAIISQMFSTATKYTFYQKVKDKVPNVFVAGAISGAMASIFTHPFDVIKIHRQMHTLLLPEFLNSGPLLLYRGYSKSLIKSSVGSIWFFPLYDTFYGYINNSSVSAMMSAIVSTTIMQPIDYMKVRHVYGKPFFSGWNPIPYFKGLSLNLARVVPHFMLTMTIIEWSKNCCLK